MSARRWRKLGRVFNADGQASWMHSHAAVPIAEHLYDDTFRVYFSARDAQNRSSTGSFVFDINRPHSIESLNTVPAIAPGALGGFDDSGAMATWLVCRPPRRYLYYIGWNLGVTVPFRNAIGLAVSEDEGPFLRVAPGPVLDRSMSEPHFCASCSVLVENECWRMWYLSCTEWMLREGRAVHKYHIKYAESTDGIHWQRTGEVAVDFADERETAISRPSVLKDERGWHMWYSHRGASYRIGYATSDDGRCWRRRDETVGIDVSPSGWDSAMIAYPFVFDHRGQRYMLYNGNDYGRTGIGLALWE